MAKLHAYWNLLSSLRIQPEWSKLSSIKQATKMWGNLRSRPAATMQVCSKMEKKIIDSFEIKTDLDKIQVNYATYHSLCECHKAMKRSEPNIPLKICQKEWRTAAVQWQPREMWQKCSKVPSSPKPSYPFSSLSKSSSNLFWRYSWWNYKRVNGKSKEIVKLSPL